MTRMIRKKARKNHPRNHPLLTSGSSSDQCNRWWDIVKRVSGSSVTRKPERASFPKAFIAMLNALQRITSYLTPVVPTLTSDSISQRESFAYHTIRKNPRWRSPRHVKNWNRLWWTANNFCPSVQIIEKRRERRRKDGKMEINEEYNERRFSSTKNLSRSNLKIRINLN